MNRSSSNDLVSGSAQLDLAGNLVIKARFNNNFKKTTINNDELTYDELILMLQRLFNGRFDAKDDIKLKYCDEDGDLVDIDNDSDLKSAIQSNRYLKLVIYLGDEYEDDASMLEDGKISLSQKEFRKLTQTMERILESLRTNEPVKPENSTNSSFEPLNNDAPVSHALNNLTLSDSKEFDPLVNKSDDLKSDKSNAQASLNSESINSSNLNADRQPATLQPSDQQYHSTQNLQSKILNQSQPFPPHSHPQMSANQPPQQQPQSMIPNQPPPPQHQGAQQPNIQTLPYRPYGMPPPQQQQPPQPPQPQQQQQQQLNTNQTPPQMLPPNSKAPTFNPNQLHNPMQLRFNPPSNHPSAYPTPSSTPANTFTPQQITSPPGPQSFPPQSYGPPMISGPPSSLSGPPTPLNAPAPPLNSPPNSNIRSGAPSAFGPPMTNQSHGPVDRPSTVPPPPQGSSLAHMQQGPTSQSNNLNQVNGAPTSMSNSSSMNGMAGQAPPLPPTSNSNQPQQMPLGPPQFTNFPPTGPYPGQQAPKAGNPFGRNSTTNRGYVYPQQQQFN